MKIALLQTDPIVGDFAGNVEALLAGAARAAAAGADLAMAPEMATSGYPPRDRLLRTEFVTAALSALMRLRDQTPLPLLVGSIVGSEAVLKASDRIANGAVLLAAGKVLACHRKMLLPSYDVFDEARYFTPGTVPTVVNFGGERLGLSVCEDIWNAELRPASATARYAREPVAEQAAAGASLLCNLSASPYDRHKPARRLALLQAAAARHGLPVLYVNQVGGHDSLLFDGRSWGFDAAGNLRASLAAWAPDWGLLQIAAGQVQGPMRRPPADWQGELAAALTLGLRDYVHKTGFRRVVLGLSGGIDSALVATLAVRALGADNVHGLALPSRYSSTGSLTDAQALADNLGIVCDKVPIEPVFAAYLDSLAPTFAGRPADVTEENLQARIRGALLMAWANKFGALLLTTGNKSEVAVGYTTLYGDMCGALAPIADLYKTEVYALAEHLNAEMRPAPIPLTTLHKAPSAELAPDQLDQDSLPPYPELDALLRDHLEGGADAAGLLQAGHDAATVQRVLALVRRSEHKRRQAAPVLKVSARAFGEGWRQPLAAL